MANTSLRMPQGRLVRILGGGGVDTCCIYHLLQHAGFAPTVVHVDWGQPYALAESYAMRMYGDDAVGVAGPRLGGLELEDGHVPHRNAVLLATAAAVYPDTDVWVLGAVKGESSPDKSDRFLRAASRLLSASEQTAVKVVAPAKTMTKAQLVGRFLALHDRRWSETTLRATHSCYTASVYPYRHCGRCMACFRRWVAFTLNGVDARFESPPHQWPGARPGARRALGYLRGTPAAEWPGILRANVDALRALRAHAG